jgi:hypothetical protein
MYRTMIRDPETRIDFFGKEYRRGDSPMPGYGTIEQYPHNTIHVWAGTSTEVGGKDMGSLYAAARDPVFYAHHAQLDRLWELWKNPLVVGRNNSDIDDDDAFLDAEFAFYDERAEMVRVRVRDCLRAAALGYRYVCPSLSPFATLLRFRHRRRCSLAYMRLSSSMFVSIHTFVVADDVCYRTCVCRRRCSLAYICS